MSKILKSDLRRISNEFRMYGSRLLTTNDGNGMSDLNRFLNYIESEPVIFDFIKKNNTKEYNIEEIKQQKDFRSKYPLPIKKNEEIAFIYQLLKYGQSKFSSYWAFAFGGYGYGDKIDDHIEAFNQEVVKHLIDYIRTYLEELSFEIDESRDTEDETSKIFISYSWHNKDIADMIDQDFKNLFNLTLTRDERDLKFKDSIKKFMQQIGKHDYVIMIISDSYLKSENCMYEVMEVIRDREYVSKMFMILLKDEDKKFYKDYEDRIVSDDKFINLQVGSGIYSIEGKIKYINYWERKEEELEQLISTIDNDLYKIEPLKNLKRIKNITSNIGEFLETLSDLKGESLEELVKSNYKSFANSMNLSFK